MIIVTTPMCEKILEFAGINDYKVNKNPDEEEGDLAILLSENKTQMNCLNIKLNTFLQIKESIIEVSKYNFHESREDTISDEGIREIFSSYSLANQWLDEVKKKEFQEKNSKIKIKVYSNFLKDIVEDMGFNIIDFDNEDFDYFVVPDYMKFDQKNNYSNINHKIINIPTHKNVSKDPIKRAELRYSILSNLK